MNPKYFPIERGEYVVAPGLRPLGYDFGNGDYDKKVFHITPQFSDYRKNKLECRKERLTKYFCIKELNSERIKFLSFYLINQFTQEYPDFFIFDGQTLKCSHTGDVISVDESGNLLDFSSEHLIEPKVEHVIDALSLQIEEDIALVCLQNEEGQSRDHLGMLHLCSPSHWSAEDKIGRNFFDIHAPIPGIEKINRVADKLVDTMINKGPFVRFIWSFVTDQRLNHHPIAPDGFDSIKWRGRTFNGELEIPFYFRIERQITWGFPQVGAALFTIAVSFVSGQQIKDDPYQRDQLVSALKSMTPEARVYKGVVGCFDELVGWLERD